jgi:hypothetical protein
MTSVEINDVFLKRAGEVIQESIRQEAIKDYSRTKRTPRGEPMGLPNTPKFFNSFGVKIEGKSTIVITSSWPWIEPHVEGREPYKMTWLTRQKGLRAVPIERPDGSVVIVRTPLSKGDAWIHPGALKFHFIERGVKKGRKKVMEMLAQEAIKQIKKVSLLR